MQKQLESLYGSLIDNPFKALPFDKIKSEEFTKAIEVGIEHTKKNIELIRSNTEASNFENTILALENSDDLLERISSAFFNLQHGNTDDSLEEQAPIISAKLAEHGNDIQLDAILFSKIKEVFDNIDNFKLTGEEKTLTEEYYSSFARNGALLNETAKSKLRKVDEELATLAPQYSQNILAATNGFHLTVKDSGPIKNLPESALESAKALAKEKNETGWIFNLQAPSYGPFMKFCSDEELRKTLWMAYNTRAVTENSNLELCQRIAELRRQRAHILGFKTHADFVLQKRMAKSAKTVNAFLDKLYEPSYKAAEQEVNELKDFRKSQEGKDHINPWDFGYYSEKLKQNKFKFSDEELRPYFSLNEVVQGVFNHANKLYGIEFKENTSLPVYDKDVKIYEAYQQSSGDYLGLFYTDFFPRENKRGGAWMTSFYDQKNDQRPHVAIFCNFTKPTATKPSLISFYEVQTLFHEFGHALHGLLAKGKYASLTGTNVLWDFVELPSQLMENWTYEKEALDIFASHFETGEKIPDELIKKLQETSKFQAGYASLRQISFCKVDLAWHDREIKVEKSTMELEKEIMSKYGIIPLIEGTNFSVAFSHIFAGGYSAGYYSYKWAEVLEADAFEAFKENGIYDTKTAKKFREEVLEKGGTEPPEVLYRNFRGRDPDPTALLRRSGLS